MGSQIEATELSCSCIVDFLKLLNHLVECSQVGIVVIFQVGEYYMDFYFLIESYVVEDLTLASHHAKISLHNMVHLRDHRKLVHP